MTETFTWRAEVQSGGSGEFAMSSAKFGDGYTQEVPLGLNNEQQKWSVNVSGYQTYVAACLAFIQARKGQSFFWKAPFQSAPGYWKCKRWSASDQGAAYWTLILEFEQAFAP